MSLFPVAAMRRFARKRPLAERCETCGEALQVDHEHTFDPVRRTLRCTCRLCALAQESSYPRMPKAVRLLPQFRVSERQWNDLAIPVSLAFFSYSTQAQRIVVQYPGPAGVVESLISVNSWDELCLLNSELRTLAPDVQALLVNRVDANRSYFIVPIEACYKLSGLMRRTWRGFSGGTAAWVEIASFFDDLAGRCQTWPHEETA
jgi:hypothetical protein